MKEFFLKLKVVIANCQIHMQRKLQTVYKNNEKQEN